MRQPFELPTGNIVRYTVGQPMGSLGSFPILDFTNYIVSIAACFVVDPLLNPEHMFRIVGDDIVFSDIRVQKQYIQFMQSIGVPISTSKTYSTGAFAQAVGREIFVDRDGYNKVIYPLKFSNHTYTDDARMRP